MDGVEVPDKVLHGPIFKGPQGTVGGLSNWHLWEQKHPTGL